MEFRILGPLEVEEDGSPIALAGAKQRSLLALLLLEHGRAVSTDRLIEEIWNGGPPETALKSIQVYVSQLRKALGNGRLITRGHGYELVVEPNELDADRFDALVRDASGLPARQRSAALGDALALFRGEPLADLRLEPWVEPVAAGLEERRLHALESRIDAELELGRHSQVVAELEALVFAHPYREAFVAQLMLALYRSGRQAEALAAYRHGAARLRDELGLEPGRELQALECSILSQDARLDAPRQPALRRGGRRRAWTIVLAGAAVLLVSAVAAGVVVLKRGGTGTLATVPPGVAILDGSSGRLIAHIPWDQLRWPTLVFKGDGDFWVWTLDGNALVRIDPDTGRILQRIGSPLGADTIWARVEGRSIWFAGPRLVRMDIASGTEADRFALTDDPSSDSLDEFDRGAGSFWIAQQRTGSVLRVDPATGRVQKRFTGLLSPYAVRFADGAAWVVTYNGVRRIDAATNTIVTTALPPPVAELAAGGGFVWVSNEAKGVVYKLDRAGEVVATYATGDGARDMAYDDGTLWVVNQDVGTLTGIDAITGAQRTYRFGHPVQTVGAINGKVLVAVSQGHTWQDQIDALPGKVARVVMPTFEFDHPDPAIGGNGKVHWFFFQAQRATCAPLLVYPDAPPPRGQRLVPELAAALPSLSGDRRTYTFVVRGGFRFAPPSNAPVDAQTVRFSIERALSPKLGPRAPGIGFLPDLEGARAFHAGRAPHVSGIRVHGDRISFTLTRPSPDFLERLSVPYFCPVPQDTLLKPEGVGVYTGPAPAGSGPYTFSGFVVNGELSVLKRNPNYGGRRPQRLDSIAFREGLDVEQGVARVLGGRFDATEQYDEQLYPTGGTARRLRTSNSGSQASYRAFPARVTQYLAFDTRRPPFSDRHVRAAIAAAIDRSALAPFSYSQTATEHLLPRGVRGAPAPGMRRGRLDRMLFRPRAAVTIRMAVLQTDERQRQLAKVLDAQLAPLGIRVQAVEVDDVGAAMRDPGAGIQLVSLSTTLDYPDPASFLTRMLGEDVPASWLPPDVRQRLARLGNLLGMDRDRAAVALAARLEKYDVPVVAVATQELGTVVGPRLGCRVWNGVDAGFDLASLCLR